MTSETNWLADARRSRMSWLQIRQLMSQRRDRAAALTVLKLAGYEPLPWQGRFHLADAGPGTLTNKLAICGLGAGKTHAFVQEAGILAIINPGGWGVLSAPTYDQLTNVTLPRFLALCEALAAAGFPILRRYHKTSAIAELWCGGRVFLRSMNKVDNLRSFEFVWGGLDECEIVLNASDVFDVVSSRVRALGATPEMFGCSTPRGLRGVVEIFHRNREALKAKDATRLREWYCIRATSMDNPRLPPGYLDGRRATFSVRRWREEIEAEILKPESGVWASDIDAQRHVVPGFRFAPGVPYDLAYDAGDQYPHVLWIQRFPDGRCVVFDEFCEDGLPPGRLHDLIVARCSHLKQDPEHAVGDRAVPSELAWLQHQFPRTQVHRMRDRASQLVSTGIELVRDRLDPIARPPGSGLPPLLQFAGRLVPSPSRRGIWNCVRNYRYRVASDGTITIDPLKDNVHDHGADALRMHQVALFGQAGAFFQVDRRW